MASKIGPSISIPTEDSGRGLLNETTPPEQRVADRTTELSPKAKRGESGNFLPARYERPTGGGTIIREDR